jgi:N-carbamoylputrescine amidase
MKVTVCQFNDEPRLLERDWEQLVTHVKWEASELIVLPEMPFHPWIAGASTVKPGVWEAAVDAHEKWISRFRELVPATILGTRPVVIDGKRLNEGFVWHPKSGYRAVHHKYYLPDEKKFWEASWYDRGTRTFTPVRIGNVKVGMLICTEMWFMEHARAFARERVHLLVCPRATPMTSTDKWIAGGRAAAVVSGAFCLSSNRGHATHQGTLWGGNGWIVEPEEGRLLGTTTPEAPFLSLDIDLKVAEHAKKTYPRYVKD